jgi:transcriptional regulator with XRE-family HTH domain
MATLKVSSLGDYIREQRESAQVSLRQLAKTAGVSNPYLSQIERGMKKPSAEILAQIAKGLRISAETLYVHAGILDEREPSDVVAAILADPAIGERHRRILLDVYASFRAEHAADVMAHSAAAAKPTTKTGTPKASAKRATAKKASAKKASATSAKKTSAKKTSAKKTSATKATKAAKATQTRTTPTQ